MCGFIFQINKNDRVNEELFSMTLDKISWRGPDAQKTMLESHGQVCFGHCRLSIIDPVPRSDQPMKSLNDRYTIVFNGEIYNHKSVRENLKLSCRTTSDTETILEGYSLIGNKIFEMLEGMFAVVIYDNHSRKWVAARDAFGIKPLYIYRDKRQTILSSEAAAIASLTKSEISEDSLEEWRLIRRPIPGKTYFNNIDEVMPGTIIDSDGYTTRHWQWESNDEEYLQDKFEDLMVESVKAHELSDVENVSLLSGGLDSAIIAALSDVKRCYTVGLIDNNEFEGANETSAHIQRELIEVKLENEELVETWKMLTQVRGEPLSLPNEGLIYKVCAAMEENEKVVLTGEGADELLFGYDGIYRWSMSSGQVDPEVFLRKYGYSNTAYTSRLEHYVSEMMEGKSTLDFVEDFFYQVHLPGLLRRMDFSSMAASKEARVPFVDKKLIQYMYRKPSQIRINDNESKIPIREFAKKLGLEGALRRKKIGFSAQTSKNISRQDDYKSFQKIIMETLGW